MAWWFMKRVENLNRHLDKPVEGVKAHLFVCQDNNTPMMLFDITVDTALFPV